MKIQKVLLLLLPLFITSATQAQMNNNVNPSFQEKVPSWLAENQVPAIGIGIIEDGKIKFVKVFGEIQKGGPAVENTLLNMANGKVQFGKSFGGLQKGVPASNNTFFNIASLSKPISTLLTLLLVSHGEWDLDEPLYHFWVDPDVKNDPFHKKLTTRHVLTHQTGFDNWRRMNTSKKLTFNFEPGTKCKYSGEGFEYLRHAMEQKFKKPWEALVDSILFKPYGMNDTRLLWNENMHKSRFAGEHNKKGEPYHLPKRVTNACASDDVLTTIEDYCLFCVDVMKGSGLTKEVYHDMLSLQGIADEKGGFGLGWYIKLNFYNGEYAIVHDGSDPGVATRVILLPKSKRGIVMFTNGDNGFDVIKKVEAAYFSSGY